MGGKGVIDMLAICSSDVRKDWSGVMDSVIRRKPAFIRRTRDYMMLSSVDMIYELVSGVQYIADEYQEDDGTVTLSLRDMDIAVNGPDAAPTKKLLVQNIMEYAEEYYSSFELYFSSPNRRPHLPYVIKALTAKSPDELEGAVLCRPGEN